jgi:hypothetical protein
MIKKLIGLIITGMVLLPMSVLLITIAGIILGVTKEGIIWIISQWN